MKVVKKMYFVWNMDKEKAFLEEMAQAGYMLVKVSFGKYYFEACEPEKVSFNFDFKGLDRMTVDEFLGIYEDAGWEMVCNFGMWYYFAKKGEAGHDAIFNNNDSKASRFRRILFFLLLTGFPLYYQAFIMFPAMEAAEFSLPSFYGILAFIIYPLAGLHLMVLAYFLITIWKLSKRISE
jgi:hypothetical protein